MKKLLILAASALILTGAAQAMPSERGNCGEGKGRGPNIEQMQQSMGLSDDQAAAVEKIFTEQHESAQKMREEHRAEMKEHREQTKERLSTVLNEEQMQQLEERQQKRMEKREHRRHQQGDEQE